MDEHILDLRRRYLATLAHADGVAWLRASVQASQIAPDRFLLALALGDARCLELCDSAQLEEARSRGTSLLPELIPTLQVIAWGAEACARAAISISAELCRSVPCPAAQGILHQAERELLARDVTPPGFYDRQGEELAEELESAGVDLDEDGLPWKAALVAADARFSVRSALCAATEPLERFEAAGRLLERRFELDYAPAELEAAAKPVYALWRATGGFADYLYSLSGNDWSLDVGEPTRNVISAEIIPWALGERDPVAARVGSLEV